MAAGQALASGPDHMGRCGSLHICGALACNVGGSCRHPGSNARRDLRQGGGRTSGLLHGPAYAAPWTLVLSLRCAIPTDARDAHWGTGERADAHS